MSLVIRVGAVYVHREENGVRVTIPIKDSSTVLTMKEAHELTRALVKLFPKRGGNPA